MSAQSRFSFRKTLVVVSLLIVGLLCASNAFALKAIKVAAGMDFSLVLLENGLVESCGYNNYGQLGNGTTTGSTVPIQVLNLTDVTDVSAATFHSIALKKDGTVWAWGNNYLGRLGDGSTSDSSIPVKVANLNDVKALSAGGGHSIVLKKDGTVWAWGSGSPVPVQISNLSEVTSIAAGYNHSIALKSDGTVWTWTYGSATSVQVSRLTGIIALAAGNYHSLALKDDGTVWAWGKDGLTIDSGTPVQIFGLTGVTALAAGYYHSLALKNDGTVWAWGSNEFGQLGNGKGSSSSIPVQVSNLTGAKALAAAYYHSLTLKNDGTVWAWGRSNYGQLGNGTTTDSALPIKAYNLMGIKALAAGNYYSLALKNDGTVWSWGSNPVQIPGLAGIKAVAAGGGIALALGSDGTVWSWGSTPVQVPGLTGIKALAAGGEHSLALKEDGTVWAWGRNQLGQLGNGSIMDSAIPVKVSNLTGIAALSAGLYHSLALKNDGSVWAWGGNSDGQLGNGTTAATPVPLRVSNLSDVTDLVAGGLHSLALKNDGTVWAWGKNNYRQLGNVSTNNKTIPELVANLTGVTALAAGYHHSLAIKSNGTIWASGRNDYGQLGYGLFTPSSVAVQVSTPTGVTSLAAGYYHSIALKNDGTVWAWGSGDYGQLGNDERNPHYMIFPPTFSSETPLEVAMSEDGSPTAWTKPSLTVTDIDTSADNLMWSIASQPIHGDVDVSGNGASPSVLSYLPHKDYFGSDSFVIQVSDGTLTDSRTLNVTVLPVNDAPVISQGSSVAVTMSEDGSQISWAAPAISATDVDTAPSTLVWSLLTPPINGAADVSGSGPSPNVLTYFPAKDYNGSDSLVVQVSDGSLTNTITVDVTVEAVNDPPVISGQKAFATKEAMAKTVTLEDIVVVDVDNTYPTGFKLSVGSGQHYSVAGTTVTPDIGFMGNLELPVIVNDGQADSNTYTMVIAVNDNPTPEAPKVTANSPAKIPSWFWNSSSTGNYRYKLDSSDFYTGAILTTALNYTASPAPADGDHTLYVEVRNENYEWSNAGSAKVLVDNTPPVASITYPPNGAIVKDLPELDGVFSDNLTAISSVEIQIIAGSSYWNGSAFVTTPTWLPATTFSNETKTWNFDTFFFSWIQDRTYTLKCRATDAAGNVSSAYSATFTYGTAVAQAPVILQGTSISAQMSMNGSPLAWPAPTISAADPDTAPQSLTWSVPNQPLHGTATVSGKGASPIVFSYVPQKDFAGTDSFMVQVSDGTMTDSITVNVTVKAPNIAPVLSAIGNRSTEAGTMLSIQLQATDANGDTLTYGGGNLPASSSLDPSTGLFTWLPITSDVGMDFTVTFNVTDNGVPPLGDSETITITVGATNQPPKLDTVGTNNTVGAKEGDTITFTISATDPENGNLNYTLSNRPNGSTFVDRTFTWVTGPGSAGNYQLTASVTDDGLVPKTDTVIITLNVGEVNWAPVLNAIGNKTVRAEKNLFFTVTASDPDNDTLAYSAINVPTGANFTNQQFSWTPTADQTGNHEVTFKVEDNGNPPLNDTELVTITVGNANRPPVLATIGPRSINENELLTFTLNGSDPDGDAITYYANQMPAGGTLDANTGVFSWTPGYAQSGSYQVILGVTDGELTANEEITVTVGNVNRPPVLGFIGPRSGYVGTQIVLTATATDPDNDSLRYSISPVPTNAGILEATGQFGWMPTTAGTFDVTFTVTDGALTDSEIVTFTITTSPAAGGGGGGGGGGGCFVDTLLH